MDDPRRWSTETGKATGQTASGPLRKSPFLMRAGGEDSAVLTVFSRASQQNMAASSSVGVTEPAGSDLQAPLLQAKEESCVQSKLDFACAIQLRVFRSLFFQPVVLFFAETNFCSVVDVGLGYTDNISWAVNLFLLVGKGYAYYFSGSKAVLASLVDSFVDLVSQLVIFVAEWRSHSADPRFPVGQARLETLGVLACGLLSALA